MKRVRFATSPTGSLHVDNALSAVANRALGDCVVDDVDFRITHVVRGNDHRPNEPLHRRLHEALGTRLSKRAEGATVASLREAGIPPEAVRRYLEQLDLPKHDVRYDLPRIRLALTGRDRGPELAAVVAALDRAETLRRLDAAV